MKALTSFTFILLLNILFCAQNFAQYKAPISIYFESGQATLNQEAQMILDSFIMMSQDWQSVDIEIQAYSDDIGESNQNNALSNQRAIAVQNYLENKHLPISSILLNNAGEVALNSNINIDQQRKNNRRVDIHFTPFIPQSLEEFYEHHIKINTQQFKIDAKTSNTIVGNKGIIITIPANSLCLANGEPVVEDQDVIIELREAYTYQDMLFENLMTTSQGKLLETDGMFYIGAATVDGQEVFVKEGKEMEVMIPSQRSDVGGLELFYADRSNETPEASIDWIPENISIKRFNFNLEDIGTLRLSKYIDSLSNLEMAYTIDVPMIIKEIPIRPSLPQKPRLTTVKPTMELIEKRYARRKKEKKLDYEARLVELYKRDSSVYALNHNHYTNQMKIYQVDSAEYAEKMVVYNAKLAEYNDSRAVFLSWLETDKEQILEWISTLKWYQGESQGVLMGTPSSLTYLERYQKVLEQRAYHYDTLVYEIQQLWTPEIVAAMDSLKLCTRKAFMHIHNAKTNTLTTDKNSTANLTAYLERQLAGWEPFNRDADTASIIDSVFIKLNKRVPTLNDQITQYNEALDIEMLQHYLAIVNDYRDKLLGLAKPFIEIERNYKYSANYGQMSEDEKQAMQAANDKLVNNYINQINIDRLSWANLDILLDIGADEGEYLLVEDDRQTTLNQTVEIKYIAFCKNNRSMIELEPISDEVFKTSVYLPKNEYVTVIALKAESGIISIHQTKGIVGDLGGLTNADFEQVSLGELRLTLGT